MNVTYTYDVNENIYIGSASNELGYISEVAETFAELEQKIRLVTEMLYEDKADEFNSLEESAGSFRRFQFPEPKFNKVAYEEFFNE